MKFFIVYIITLWIGMMIWLAYEFFRRDLDGPLNIQTAEEGSEETQFNN